MTLREWFDQFTAATSEVPTHIVFGWEHSFGQDNDWPEIAVNEVMLYASVAPDVWDHKFDDGYGARWSPDFCAWSPSWVVFSDAYDGAESVVWVPRHPMAHEPVRPGGG